MGYIQDLREHIGSRPIILVGAPFCCAIKQEDSCSSSGGTTAAGVYQGARWSSVRASKRP